MLLMPAPDQEAIDDRERIAADLATLLPPASVIAAPAALKVFRFYGIKMGSASLMSNWS